MRWFFSCLLTVVFGLIFGVEEDRPLSSITVDPPSLFLGCVHTPSGGYQESRTDLTVRSAEPIAVTRVSSTVDGLDDYRRLWRLQDERVVFSIGRQRHRRKEPTIWLQEASGTIIPFQLDRPRDGRHPLDSERWTASVVEPEGLYNTAGGTLSGRTDLANYVLEFDRHRNLLTLTTGSGEQRLYRTSQGSYWYDRVARRKNRHLVIEHFLLREVRRPSGNRLIYSYDPHGRVRVIQAVNATRSQVLGWVHFRYSEDDGGYHVRVNSSDRQSASYALMERDGKIFSSVHRPGGDERHCFRRSDKSLTPDRLWSPGGRAFGFKTDEKAGRVEAVSLAGSSLARLDYDDRRTLVADACGNRRVYCFDHRGRVSRIRFLDADGRAHHEECFGWARGRLVRWSLCDAFKQTVVAHEYAYDRKGNVRREVISGPEEVASVKELSYSNDSFNLLLSATNGRIRIEYRYRPGTALLVSQLTYEGRTLREREFYEYDGNGVRVRTIWDDGCDPCESVLDGVTCRRIHCVQPRSDFPGIGLPEVEEERYLELDTGEERLLRRVVLYYSPENLVIRRDVYDAEGALRYSLEAKHDAAGRVVWETDALGQETTTEYTEAGQVRSKSDGQIETRKSYGSYGLPSLLTRTADGDGVSVQMEYDAIGRKITSTHSHGGTTRYAYDCVGNLICTEFPDGAQRHQICDAAGNLVEEMDGGGAVTRHGYDGCGRRVYSLYPDGTEECWEYDLQGHLVWHGSPTGAVTCYERDYRGRVTCKRVFDRGGSLISEISAAYKGNSLRSQTDAAGRTVTYLYDDAGRLVEEEGRVYEYDALGRRTCCLNHGQVTNWEYDLLGRVITESHEGELFRRCAYDRQGHLVSETFYDAEGRGQTTSWDYDFAGRLVREVDPLGCVTHRDYVALNGLLACSINTPGGCCREVLCDARGLPVSLEWRTHPAGSSLTRSIERDSLGRRILLTDTCDERSIITSWEYNSSGRIVSQVEAVGSLEERQTRRYYSAWGQLKSLVRPGGGVWRYCHDCLGRRTSWTGADFAYAFEYDACGRLTRVMSSQGCDLERAYDSQGRVISERLANGLSICAEYDELGRRTRLGLPDGSFIGYEYGPRHLRRVARYSSDSAELYSQGYERFDSRGLPLSVRLPGNAGVATYSWDGLGRCVSVAAPNFRVDASYDSDGNLSSVQTNGEVKRFVYDAFGHLTEESGHTYAYDGLGVRVVEDGTRAEVNALNQVLRDAHGAYAYDEAGRTIECRCGEEVTCYRYDSRDNMSEVCTDERRVCLTYDCLGRYMSREEFVRDERSSSWYSRGSLRFLWDGMEEIGAVDEAGDLVQFRVPSLPGLFASLELSGSTYIPIQDLRKSVVGLVNLSGHVVEHAQFSAFGCPLRGSVIGNPWCFCGGRFDSATGLHYFGCRALLPKSGRWLTVDPAGFSQGMNLYEYCRGNPWNYRDPDGRFVICVGLALAALTWTGVIESVVVGVGLAAACWGVKKLASSGGSERRDAQFVDCMLSDIAHPRPKLSPTGVVGLLGVPSFNPIYSHPITPRPAITTWHDEVTEQDPSLPPGRDHVEAGTNGWIEVSHPDQAIAGHHEMLDPISGDKWRYDEEKIDKQGRLVRPHWHHENPNRSGDEDHYLDAEGVPCPKKSYESHIWIEDT